MEECLGRTYQYFMGLTTRALANIGKLDISADGKMISIDLKEKHLMKIFHQFLNFLNPEYHPFPAHLIANDVYNGMGKSGFDRAEQPIKDFLTHILHLYWLFMITPQTNDLKPIWKEDLSDVFYNLVNDLNIKDGAIRYPPLITNDGRVLMKGEARPVKKGGSAKKK